MNLSDTMQRFDELMNNLRESDCFDNRHALREFVSDILDQRDRCLIALGAICEQASGVIQENQE